MKFAAYALAVGCLAALLGSALGPASAAPSDYADPDQMYMALGRQSHDTLIVDGGTIDLVFADGAPGLDHALVKAWVLTSAKAVSTYFGRFPVKHVGLLVIADEGEKVEHGTTYGYAGSAIRIHVGRATDANAFKRDWVLVHEMTHLALPDIPRRSWWLLEGSATYVEPIARVQAGNLMASDIWRDMVRDMPKGLPMPGDLGLDEGASWARTYWGGALFLMQADIEIRERTGNRKGLQDALRAINRQSGGNEVRWSVEQLVAAGDAETGTDVLAALYAAEKDAPVEVDLSALFARVGIFNRNGKLQISDARPSAAIRAAITAVPHCRNEDVCRDDT